MNLKFGQYFAADAWLRLWSLIMILKLMFGRDSGDGILIRLCQRPSRLVGQGYSQAGTFWCVIYSVINRELTSFDPKNVTLPTRDPNRPFRSLDLCKNLYDFDKQNSTLRSVVFLAMF